MKRSSQIILLLLVLALVQMACSLPTVASVQATPTFSISTATGPAVVTATLQPTAAVATATSQGPVIVTATTAPQVTVVVPTSQPTCNFVAAFVADISIPDDTNIPAGATFVKTWRLRNDGNCAWGPGGVVNALVFTGGNKLGAPDQVVLGGNVNPGQTVDISVNMVAPTTAGTYTSEWKLRLGNTFLGIGANKNSPIYARIRVGATPTTKPPTAEPVTSTRITFPEGGTYAGINGTVKGGKVTSYVLGAAKSQLMMVNFSSAAPGMALKVIDATTNNVLVQNTTSAQIVLPTDGDYLIQLSGNAADGTFSMGVTIPRRISFDPGGTSKTLDGKISGRAPVTYLLRAQEGQTMTVIVTTPQEATTALTIYGLDDGQPLVRADFGLTSWAGELPKTQDYVIMVVPSVDSTTFTIQTIVE